MSQGKGIRYGGRSKGTPNKKTLQAQELADSLGINPFEVLLHFIAGDYKALKLEKTKTLYTSAGESYEVDMITPEIRLQAAKEAVQYLLPKRKALEIDANVDLELAKKAQEIQEMSKEEQIELMEQELARLRGT